MTRQPFPTLEQCGRVITIREVEEIISTVADFPQLSLSVLAETICEHLEWYTATGRYKKDACLKLLIGLEKSGLIRLPEKKKRPVGSAGQSQRSNTAKEDFNQTEMCGSLQTIQPVTVEVVTSRADVNLWNRLVGRYHYLGSPRPFGCFVRYFAKSSSGDIVACALFSGAARALTARDQWIGWDKRQRLRNLPWVINNSRYLILPRVKISFLASHILSLISLQITQDWEAQWGYRPLLMETFVDPLKYSGVCYKASNWQCLGQTSGRGLVRRGKSYRTSPKLVFVRPLAKNFRKRLNTEPLVGKIES
jgi:hypothetical protein